MNKACFHAIPGAAAECCFGTSFIFSFRPGVMNMFCRCSSISWAVHQHSSRISVCYEHIPHTNSFCTKLSQTEYVVRSACAPSLNHVSVCSHSLRRLFFPFSIQGAIVFISLCSFINTCTPVTYAVTLNIMCFCACVQLIKARHHLLVSSSASAPPGALNLALQ